MKLLRGRADLRSGLETMLVPAAARMRSWWPLVVAGAIAAVAAAAPASLARPSGVRASAAITFADDPGVYHAALRLKKVRDPGGVARQLALLESSEVVGRAAAATGLPPGAVRRVVSVTYVAGTQAEVDIDTIGASAGRAVARVLTSGDAERRLLDAYVGAYLTLKREELRRAVLAREPIVASLIRKTHAPEPRYWALRSEKRLLPLLAQRGSAAVIVHRGETSAPSLARRSLGAVWLGALGGLTVAVLLACVTRIPASGYRRKGATA